jgi:hypothetical protein
MRKISYVANLDKGYKTAWHFEGPLGNVMCARMGSNVTSNIKFVTCLRCLIKMREQGIIDEATYNELRNSGE